MPDGCVIQKKLFRPFLVSIYSHDHGTRTYAVTRCSWSSRSIKLRLCELHPVSK